MVIVVIGPVAFEPAADGGGRGAGAAAAIALAAAAAGSQVELLAKVGEDGAGEELLLALARGGVGHLAVLRDAAQSTVLVPTAPETAAEDDVDLAPGALLGEAVVPAADGRDANGHGPAAGPGLELEPADLGLGLRYLRDFRVVVTVEPLAAGCAPVVAEAASFADAALVVIAAPGTSLSDAYASATVLETPAEDPDGAFAALVGRFAAALDRGEAPGDALRGAVAAGGWEAAEG